MNQYCKYCNTLSINLWDKGMAWNTGDRLHTQLGKGVSLKHWHSLNGKQKDADTTKPGDVNGGAGFLQTLGSPC